MKAVDDLILLKGSLANLVRKMGTWFFLELGKDEQEEYWPKHSLVYLEAKENKCVNTIS